MAYRYLVFGRVYPAEALKVFSRMAPQPDSGGSGLTNSFFGNSFFGNSFFGDSFFP